MLINVVVQVSMVIFFSVRLVRKMTFSIVAGQNDLEGPNLAE